MWMGHGVAITVLLCGTVATGSAQLRQPPRTGTARVLDIVAAIQLDAPPARANDPTRSNTVRYTGGEWLGATVTLVSPAPAAGIRIDFRSSNPNVRQDPAAALRCRTISACGSLSVMPNA